jgi:hypothetical protein
MDLQTDNLEREGPSMPLISKSNDFLRRTATANDATEFLKAYNKGACANALPADHAALVALVTDSINNTRIYAGKTLFHTNVLENIKKKAAARDAQQDAYTKIVDVPAAQLGLLGRYTVAYDALKDGEQSNARAEANSAQPPANLDQLNKELADVQTDIAKEKDAAQLNNKISAFRALRQAKDELEKAYYPPTPGEAAAEAEKATKTAQDELAVYKDVEKRLPAALDPKLNGMADAVDQKVAARIKELNGTQQGEGPKATEDEKKAAKQEGRKQVGLWLGLGGGAAIIGLAAGLLILGNKMSHKNAEIHQLLLLIQAAQNSSPDQSQAGPQSPYPASQNGFGGYQQQYAQAGR